jgi:hypothetical protein
MQATGVTELVGHNLALVTDSAVVAYSAIVPWTSQGVPWLFNVTELAASRGICHAHPHCVCPARKGLAEFAGRGPFRLTHTKGFQKCSVRKC